MMNETNVSVASSGLNGRALFRYLNLKHCTVAMCSLAESDRCFGGAYFRHRQSGLNICH
jgi:hypothetical protein